MKSSKVGTASVAIILGLLAGCAGHKPAMFQPKPATPQALTEDAFFKKYADQYPCKTTDPRAIALHMVDPWSGKVSCLVQRPLPEYCHKTSDQGMLPDGYKPVWLLTGGINDPDNETHIPVVATPEAAARIANWNDTLRRIRIEAGELIEGLRAYNPHHVHDDNRPDISYNLVTLLDAMSGGSGLAIAPGREDDVCSFVIGTDSAEFVFRGTNTFYVTAGIDGFVTYVVEQTGDGNVSSLHIPQGHPFCLGWPEGLQRGIGSLAGNLATQCLAEKLGAREPLSHAEGVLFLDSLGRQLFLASYITQGLPECCPPDSCKASSGKILGTE